MDEIKMQTSTIQTMTELISSLISLSLSVYCYVIGQLQQHGQLRWMHNKRQLRSFWDDDSWLRKYKLTKQGTVIPAPKNFYYKYIAGVPYKERWFTSTNLTVVFTDGYRASQSLFFSFIALSLTFAIGWNLWLFIGLMFGIRVIHWSGRKVFKK